MICTFHDKQVVLDDVMLEGLDDSLESGLALVHHAYSSLHTYLHTLVANERIEGRQAKSHLIDAAADCVRSTTTVYFWVLACMPAQKLTKLLLAQGTVPFCLCLELKFRHGVHL